MAGMQDEFDSKLQAGFEDANAARERSKTAKELASKQPEELAVGIADVIARGMEEWREQAAGEWGVDITDLDGLANTGLESRGLSEDLLLISKINLFHAHAELLQKLEGYAADPSLGRDELIAKACETALESLEVFESSKLHNMREIRLFAERHFSEDAAREAKDAEARYLAGHLATRISMRNRRLRTALDEIREHKKPASRERFEVLLRELYILVSEVWDEHHSTDWRLIATRNAAVKKIEQRLSSTPTLPPGEIELATFVDSEDRKRLLKRGRDAGLPPREYQVLEFLVENPRITSVEIAQRLGISASAVRTLKSRIEKTLNAA